mgnify:FL=1|jgi:hypothetical protein
MTREQRNEYYNKELRDYFEMDDQTPLNETMLKFTKHLKEWEKNHEPTIDESEYPKTRKLTNPKTGDVAICWDNKFHNWDGPALYPEGNKRQGEYYLYGIRYDVEEWKEMKKQWEGLPWYKTPSILMDAGTARN